MVRAPRPALRRPPPGPWAAVCSSGPCHLRSIWPCQQPSALLNYWKSPVVAENRRAKIKACRARRCKFANPKLQLVTSSAYIAAAVAAVPAIFINQRWAG